ncbi:MAG TPA: PKD domain-containing protein, partial [Candidatus Saccharimonadales bacterium]|nr:PKD domain-containing protein [Candidatus Saccharimonadales bacterium]
DDLVGCDTLSSLGFAYNSTNSDEVYGTAPPCIGWKLLQGPLDHRTGHRLLMTSFNRFINGTDPVSAQQSYYYMQGLTSDGLPLTDPNNGQVTKFDVAGDPVKGTGNLDASAGDRRLMLSSGPFEMAPGDTQDIAVAVVVGRGSDHLSSITSMKLTARAAEAAFYGPAPAKLLLQAVCTLPTAAEYVAIYNPADTAVDLSDVYLTDATNLGAAGTQSLYCYLPTGSYYVPAGTPPRIPGGGSAGDFHARFPQGATLAAHDTIAVALHGSAEFVNTYGRKPAYEFVFPDEPPVQPYSATPVDDPSVPNMRPAFAGAIPAAPDSAALLNAGESVVLYHWDGRSPLVTDLDYVFWGKNTGSYVVDKTGVSVNGSAYLADTPAASQVPVDTTVQATGTALRREDFAEGAQKTSGGNGVGGRDETSENLAATWSSNHAAVPPAVKAQLAAHAGGPYSGVAGHSIAFDGSGSGPAWGGTITAYGWSFGDGGTGTGVRPTHAYSAAGTYKVVLTVGGSVGGTSTDSSTATVAAMPAVTGFEPDSGSYDAVVALTGSGFSDSTWVQFNGTPAVEQALDSASRMRVRVPWAARTGRVTVGYRAWADTSASSFTVLQARIVHSTAAMGIQSISFPLAAQDVSLAPTDLGLGAYDTTSWRLGHWSPGLKSYLEPGTGVAKLRQSEGYWLIARAAHLLQVGTPGLPADTVEIALKPDSSTGWNQLGNPFFNRDIHVDSLLVESGGQRHRLTDPLAPGWTEHAVEVWNGHDYEADSIIPAGAAFWVKKTTLVPVNLLLPLPRLAAAHGAPRRAAETEPLRGPAWEVQITASQGEERAQRVGLVASGGGAGGAASGGGGGRTGAPASGAAGAWDPSDLSLVPPPPGRSLVLYVPERDWGSLSDRYVRVVRPAADSLDWLLELAGARVPGEVNLDFEARGLPAGAHVVLADSAGGVEREITPPQRVTLAAGARPLRLRIQRAAPAGVPAGPVCRVYPNPFLDRVGLVFNAAEARPIRVDVFDVAGRLVRRLVRASATAGENVLVWDGTDRDGRTVGAGLFFARYEAGGTRGVVRLVRVR